MTQRPSPGSGKPAPTTSPDPQGQALYAQQLETERGILRDQAELRAAQDAYEAAVVTTVGSAIDEIDAHVATLAAAEQRVATLRQQLSVQVHRHVLIGDALFKHRQQGRGRVESRLREQIEEITRTRELTQAILIRAPTTGFLSVRNVSPTQRFEKGNELFRIADLSRVWIVADLFENESRYLQPGKNVTVSLPHEGATFQAKVSHTLPQFDPVTRTLKFRLEADNPGYVLKPDMFVDLELPINLLSVIAVPADAVLDSGLKKTVFVDRGSGFFEPREVETGRRMGNRVEIIKGLKPGEQIAVSGNFLIDSESRLELAAAGMVGTLSKDPVSGVDVSINKAEKAGRKRSYKGMNYYFSSDESKEQFDKNPNRYTKK